MWIHKVLPVFGLATSRPAYSTDSIARVIPPSRKDGKVPYEDSFSDTQNMREQYYLPQALWGPALLKILFIWTDRKGQADRPSVQYQSYNLERMIIIRRKKNPPNTIGYVYDFFQCVSSAQYLVFREDK